MKLEHAARCLELFAELDALGRKIITQQDACTCGKSAGAALCSASATLSHLITPHLLSHASVDDAAALRALTAQLVAQAAGGESG